MKIHSVITLLMILVLSGCSQEHSDNYALLLQAETIMDQDPNQALQLIYSMEFAQEEHPMGYMGNMEKTSLETKEDIALFGLLYTTAIHKIGLEIRNDSLISSSVDYYRQHHDEKRLAKALLHLGITHQSNNRWKDAVACLKQAEEMASDIHDEVFHYDVYDAIGNLNEAANCHELMLAHHQRALACATEMNSHTRMAASLNKLIRAHIQHGRLDSARVYIAQAKPILSDTEGQVKSDLLVSFGCEALEERDTVRGKKYLLWALEAFPNDYAAKRMGDILEAEGKMKEATDYWFEALNTNRVHVKIEAFEKLVRYYKNHEEWRALDLSDHLNRLYQNIRTNDKTETIAALQKEYDSRLERHRSARRLILLSAVILVLVIVIGLFVYYHRRKMRAYQLVQDRILVLQNQLSEKKEKETVADGQLMDTLLNDTTVHFFHRMANGGKVPDKGQWKELYELIQRVLPDFLPSVNRNGLLSERDMRICMLIKLRFVPTEIATLIGLSPQSVTNSRTRLLQTIFGVKGGAREFDARIRQLKD